MTLEIIPYEAGHADALASLALEAWKPVFASLRSALPGPVYEAFYPQGWQERHRADMLTALTAPDCRAFVARQAADVAGFAVVKLHAGDRMGEIYVVGVAPDRQNEGVGLALTQFCLDVMKAEGMSIAMVETAEDPGHAPARRLYERAGFELWPVARYFRAL